MSTLTDYPPAEHVLLDTCAWLDAYVTPEKLNGTARLFLESNPALKLSAISPWEVAILVQKKRIELNMPIDAWLERALIESGVQLMPLTHQISVESANLPGDFHKDPADRIIVATARLHNLTVLTSDGKIHDYTHVSALQSR